MLELDLVLRRQNGSPIYRQIAEQIRSMIIDGRLQSGTRLPPVRDLADKLGVSRLTVFQAYTELRTSGLVEANVGRGTVVAANLPRKEGTLLLGQSIEGAPLNMFEQVSDAIGLRSLASSVPDPEFFHSDELLAECLSKSRQSPWAFYYAPAQGASELLVQIVDLLKSRRVPATERELLITNGSTHGRSLVLHVLGARGDVALVEQPGYLEARIFLRNHGIQPIGIPMLPDGWDMQALQDLVRKHKPKFVIVSPSYGGTLGYIASAAKRNLLLELSKKHGFIIVEDDAYGLLALGQKAPPPLAAYDRNVIYVDSFSYSLAPGVRMGFVRAPASIRELMVSWSQSTGISGVHVMQLAMAEYLKAGRLQAHLERVLPKYRARKEALMDSLSRYMPPTVTWTQPEGGFSTWVTLPKGGDYHTLIGTALERGVAFAPGRMFLDCPDSDRALRLSYSTQTPEAIREAVEVLAKLIQARVP